MVLVATGTNPDEPQIPRKPGVQVVRVADVSRTAAQANILLGVAGQSLPLLLRSHEIGTNVEVDPEAVTAARETFKMAHIRLRDLLDSEPRWSVDDDMRAAFDAMHAAQTRVATAEAELTEEKSRLMTESRRPCFALSANLRKFGTAAGPVWVAFLGPMPNPDGLVGEGSSPEEALAAFDVCYHEKVKPVSSLEVRPAEPEPAKPAPRKRNKKTNTTDVPPAPRPEET
jgi:hypothetical protein